MQGSSAESFTAPAVARLGGQGYDADLQESGQVFDSGGGDYGLLSVFVTVEHVLVRHGKTPLSRPNSVFNLLSNRKSLGFVAYSHAASPLNHAGLAEETLLSCDSYMTRL